MTEKVKLPHEVAEAIKHLKTHHGGNETILAGILGNANGSCIVTLREYSQLHGFDVLLSALVNGYEVEETPEDKVRKYYEFCNEQEKNASDSESARDWRCEAHGIKNTLIFLGKTIEGVNA